MKNTPIITGWVLAASLIVVAQAAEKGGTADINIGVGELQRQQTPAARQAGQSAPSTKPNTPGQLKNKQKPSETGLLLPAVQKAREAANNNQDKSKPLAGHEATHTLQTRPTTPAQPSEVKQPGKDQETGLLLPAVQKARDAANHTEPGAAAPAGGFAPQPQAGNTASKSKSKSKAGKVDASWKVEEGEK
jgi:hypothetical protein